MAKWEAEFHQLMQSERDDYGGDFESAWKNGLGDLDELGGPEPMKYDDDGIPQLDPYKFGGILTLIIFIFLPNNDPLC